MTLFIVILFSFNRPCYLLDLCCVPLLLCVILCLSVSVLFSMIVNRVVIIFGFTESNSTKVCYFSKSTASHPSTSQNIWQVLMLYDITINLHLTNLFLHQEATACACETAHLWTCFFNSHLINALWLLKTFAVWWINDAERARLHHWSLFFPERSENRDCIENCVFCSAVVVCIV